MRKAKFLTLIYYVDKADGRKVIIPLNRAYVLLGTGLLLTFTVLSLIVMLIVASNEIGELSVSEIIQCVGSK